MSSPHLDRRSPRQIRALASVLGCLHHDLPIPGPTLPLGLPPSHVREDATEARVSVGERVPGRSVGSVQVRPYRCPARLALTNSLPCSFHQFLISP